MFCKVSKEPDDLTVWKIVKLSQFDNAQAQKLVTVPGWGNSDSGLG